jgi:hypothetical protein
MSPELVALQGALLALSRPAAGNPKARKLDWQKSIDFCTMHDAEAKIIPRGIKAGYPEEIDFAAIGRRLEKEWVREALSNMAMYPHRFSPLFKEVEKDIERLGKLAWSSAGHQSKKDVMAIMQAG